MATTTPPLRIALPMTSSDLRRQLPLHSHRHGVIGEGESSLQAPADLSFCVVWSPLPPITWILPFIGHTGIADSRGVVSDFQGSYHVGTDGRMAFGAPTRYVKLLEYAALEDVSRWDEAIREANRVYDGRVHNLCCDNCHSHVACALNRMPAQGPCGRWDMVKLCFFVFFRGHFVSWRGMMCQFLPFCFLVLLIAWSVWI